MGTQIAQDVTHQFKGVAHGSNLALIARTTSTFLDNSVVIERVQKAPNDALIFVFGIRDKGGSTFSAQNGGKSTYRAGFGAKAHVPKFSATAPVRVEWYSGKKELWVYMPEKLQEYHYFGRSKSVRVDPSPLDNLNEFKTAINTVNRLKDVLGARIYFESGTTTLRASLEL